MKVESSESPLEGCGQESSPEIGSSQSSLPIRVFLSQGSFQETRLGLYVHV